MADEVDPVAGIRAQLDRLDGDTARVLLRAELAEAKRTIAAIQRELIAETHAGAGGPELLSELTQQAREMDERSRAIFRAAWNES